MVIFRHTQPYIHTYIHTYTHTTVYTYTYTYKQTRTYLLVPPAFSSYGGKSLDAANPPCSSRRLTWSLASSPRLSCSPMEGSKGVCHGMLDGIERVYIEWAYDMVC